MKEFLSFKQVVLEWIHVHVCSVNPLKPLKPLKPMSPYKPSKGIVKTYMYIQTCFSSTNKLSEQKNVCLR